MCNEIFWTPAPTTTAFKLSKINQKCFHQSFLLAYIFLSSSSVSHTKQKMPNHCRRDVTLQAASVLGDAELIEDVFKEEPCPCNSHKEGEIAPEPGVGGGTAPKVPAIIPSPSWAGLEGSELWKSLGSLAQSSGNQQCRLIKKCHLAPSRSNICFYYKRSLGLLVNTDWMWFHSAWES